MKANPLKVKVATKQRGSKISQSKLTPKSAKLKVQKARRTKPDMMEQVVLHPEAVMKMLTPD